VLGLLFGILAILAGAAHGGFGPLSACGVDGWSVCVAWPRAVSLLVWLLFLGFVALLLAWHICDWRTTATEGAVATDSPHEPLSKSR
jgi:hypothetical protein